MDITTPPLFGSLYELIALAVGIGVAWYALSAQMKKIDADIVALRQWQEGALEKLLDGQRRIMGGHEKIMEHLIRSNDKILEALEAQKDRHGAEHREIAERILEIALREK